jgi:dATP pyrophosphohydrolase
MRLRPGAEPEFLQLRRSAGEALAGAWAIVRGRIEPGETAWQAAMRELREETSLTPMEFYALNTVETFYLAAEDSIWHCPGFCAIVANDAEVVLNTEHDAYRWTPRSATNKHFLWPGERDQLVEISRELLDGGATRLYLKLL